MWPESQLQPLFQLEADRVDDVVVDVVGRKPNDPVAFGLEPSLPPHVVSIRTVVVDGTVDLHDQLRRRAVEVGIVLADWLLPAELPSAEPAAAQANPDA